MGACKCLCVSQVILMSVGSSVHYIIPKSQSILFVSYIILSMCLPFKFHLPIYPTRTTDQRPLAKSWQDFASNFFQIISISRVSFHTRSWNFQGRLRFSKWSLSPNLITPLQNSEHTASFLRSVCKSICELKYPFQVYTFKIVTKLKR